MKTAFDCKHVKDVRAWALTHEVSERDGKYAGRIVANWSDNPAGAVCTATVDVWRGPLQEMPRANGRAGGGGYCKFSAAVEQALRGAGRADCGDMHGAGEGAVREYFERFGYTVIEVI